THGLRTRPFAAALRATRPAPIITAGFDVFVQLVIAAITTAPASRSNCDVPVPTGAFTPLPVALSAAPTVVAAAFSGIRSCGRFGAAMLCSADLRARNRARV